MFKVNIKIFNLVYHRNSKAVQMNIANMSHNDSPPILSPRVTATAAMELLDSDSELAITADTEFQGMFTDQAPELWYTCLQHASRSNAISTAESLNPTQYLIASVNVKMALLQLLFCR